MSLDPSITIIISAILSFFISCFVFLIGYFSSIKIRNLEYQIERSTKLMEECYSPLQSYLAQSIILDIPLPPKLRFYKGLLQKIELIYIRFNFVIKKENPELRKNIKFILKNAEGRREDGDVNLTTLPSLNQNHNVNELESAEIKAVFKNWRKKVLTQVNTSYNFHEEKLNQILAIRNSKWQLLKFLV